MGSLTGQQRGEIVTLLETLNTDLALYDCVRPQTAQRLSSCFPDGPESLSSQIRQSSSNGLAHINGHQTNLQSSGRSGCLGDCLTSSSNGSGDRPRSPVPLPAQQPVASPEPARADDSESDAHRSLSRGPPGPSSSACVMEEPLPYHYHPFAPASVNP